MDTSDKDASSPDDDDDVAILIEEQEDIELTDAEDEHDLNPQGQEKAQKAAAPENAVKQLSSGRSQNVTIPQEPSLKLELEPVLMECQIAHDTAKSKCKQDVVKGFLDWKAKNPTEGEETETKPETESELGSAKDVDRLYDQAMHALSAHKLGVSVSQMVVPKRGRAAKLPSNNQDSTSVPGFDSSANALDFVRQDELFSDIDPTFRQRDVEEMAVGNSPF